MTEGQRTRRFSTQINWRAYPGDAEMVDAIIHQTKETQSDLLRRLLTAEARRLGLAAESAREREEGK